MENVNKQLLDAAKSLVSALNDAMQHMNTGHDGVGPDCTKQFQALIDGNQAIAAAEQAEPTAPVVKESLTADRQEAFRVGNLVTYNQDEYPGLGTWYVQLWEGESIAARVYGNDREELSRRVTALNVVPPPAPQKAEPVARDVLTAALNEMRDACSFAVSGDIGVKSADKVMAGVDIGPIVDRHATQPPAVAVPLPPYDTFSNDDGDSWQDCPDDAKFVNGRRLCEEFELLAGRHAERVTFRVTKVPDDESDEYEAEEVTAMEQPK